MLYFLFSAATIVLFTQCARSRPVNTKLLISFLIRKLSSAELLNASDLSLFIIISETMFNLASNLDPGLPGA